MIAIMSRASGFVKQQWWSYAERHAGLAAYPKAIPALATRLSPAF
jgi:hypothetical protein